MTCLHLINPTTCRIGVTRAPTPAFCAACVLNTGRACAVNQPKGRCGCAAAPIMLWFWLRWLGVPAPVRALLPRRRHWRDQYRPYRGCGCIVKLRTLWIWIGAMCRAVKAA